MYLKKSKHLIIWWNRSKTTQHEFCYETEKYVNLKTWKYVSPRPSVSEAAYSRANSISGDQVYFVSLAASSVAQQYCKSRNSILETLLAEKGTNCSWTTCLLFYNDYPQRDQLMNGSVDIIKIWQPKLLIDTWFSRFFLKKLWTDSELPYQIKSHKDQHHSALALCSPELALFAWTTSSLLFSEWTILSSHNKYA
jgi:hypothetical protein